MSFKFNNLNKFFINYFIIKNNKYTLNLRVFQESLPPPILFQGKSSWHS